jgi:hypothetical protein
LRLEEARPRDPLSRDEDWLPEDREADEEPRSDDEREETPCEDWPREAGGES